MLARRMALLVSIWSVPGILYSLETDYAWALSGKSVPLWRAALYQMPCWYIWAVATLPVVRLARAFPFTRSTWYRAIFVHVLACLAIAFVYSAVRAAVSPWALAGVPPDTFSERMQHALIMWLPATGLTYAAVFGASSAVFHARASQRRALEAAELAASLSRAQLGALRAQIHPHFLFNALHTVAGIVRERDPEHAVEVLSTLAEILRDTFRGSPEREVPLREELAWIARYLSIQQARFRDRLEIVWRIGDGTLDALVPQLLLQPLVENAFRHGIARRPDAGRLELCSARDGDALTLFVRDDGPAFAPPAEPSDEHTGLANVRARLALLYDGAAHLTLSPASDTGAVASVVLPFRTAPNDDAHDRATPRPHRR